MDDEQFGFALPAFKPDEAVQTLKRELRALGLTEREGRFERRGLAIARAAVDGAVIQAARVRRPSHSGDVRDFVTDLKKQLAAWSDADD
jgi:hypothetical protein